MFEEKILKTIKKYGLIKDGDNIVVGVSGGPDSMALLNTLISLKRSNKIDFNFFVAHINHMIRAEADEETQYVNDFCKNNNIECFVLKEKVEKIAKEQKIGIEESGRNLRYKFFEEILEKTKSNKIATAHNLNDNAETVLMNIIRGSGTSGLKGIEPIRNNKFIRPLIECTRKEIEEYCNINNLNPRIDKSNMENTYTRNKTRNMLIPYIEENFNPNIIYSLNRLSELVNQENRYIEENVVREYKKILIEEKLGNKEQNEIVLDLKQFNSLDKVIKNRMMLYTIGRTIGTSKDIEKVNIEDLVKLCENNIGNKFLTPNKNVKVYINHGKILFTKI